MIYIYQFARVLLSRNFAYAKVRENKTLAKISEFTVLYMQFCIKLAFVLSKE